MNNNLGMQPNDFNNQNGTMQNQANNMQMNNQPMNNVPMNNQPMNNAPMNNQTMYNQQMNNMPMNGVPIPNQPVNNANMNQQYNYGYQQPNMNTGNNIEPKKSNKKFLIIALLFAVVVIAVVVILFLGKDKEKEQTDGNKENNTPPQQEENNNQDNNNSENNQDNNSSSGNNGFTGLTPDSGLTAIPEEKTDVNGEFLLAIEDVFTISGRGTVATGRVQRGSVKKGDTIEIVGIREEIITTKVAGIEMFREQLDYAEAGDNAGILLENVSREDVERGQVLAKPNSISSKKKFHAYIEVLTKEDGGRHTPFFVNYRPQFYFRTTEITGVVISFEEGFEQVSPGDKVDVTVELIAPVAMEVGTQFSIREGGRTVAKGVVTEVLE